MVVLQHFRQCLRLKHGITHTKLNNEIFANRQHTAQDPPRRMAQKACSRPHWIILLKVNRILLGTERRIMLLCNCGLLGF